MQSLLLALLLGPVLQEAPAPPQPEAQQATADATGAPETAAGRALDLQDRLQVTHETAMRTTVALFGRSRNDRPRGSGASGVLVSEDGLVLTAAHVLDSVGDRPLVRMPDGRLLDGVSLGRDDGADYGLLRLEDAGPHPFAEIGVSGELAKHEVLMMYGHSGGVQRGRPAVLRFGVLLDRRRDGMLRTTCKMMPGDSGGPVFDLDGKVVAVNSQINRALDRNYHVPVDPARDNWQRLLDDERWHTHRERGAPRPEQPAEVEGPEVLPGGAPALAEAFVDGAAALGDSVLGIEDTDGGLRGWGVLVEEGRALGKGSRLRGAALRARLGDGDAVDARVIAYDAETDLALLDVGGLGGEVARFQAVALQPGALLASVAPGGVVAYVGVLGAPEREVPQRDWGALGVRFDNDEDDDRIEVEAAFEGAPAHTAGIREGDVVVAFLGDAYTSGNALRAALRRTEPGQRVTMKVVGADGEERRLEFALTSSSRLQAMSGSRVHAAYRTETSLRRGGFPSAMNHDMPLEPSECGGPVIDLDGNVVGLNVARHDRTAAFALPPEVVRQALLRLGKAAAAE